MSNLQDLEQRMERKPYTIINDYKDKIIDNLKTKLEQKDKELQNVYPFIKEYDNGIFLEYNVVYEREGIVATTCFGKNKEMAEEYLKSLGGSKTNHNQDKIKFAVDCLNELKDFISNYYSEVIDCDYQAVYSNKIDEMILELLEENEEN